MRRPAAHPTDVVLEAVKGYLSQPGPGHADNDPGPRPFDLAAFARLLYNERRLRDAELGRDLFEDPVWDILLDLYASAGEGRKVTVTAACDASGAPSTSALRYVKLLTQQGMIARDDCPVDARRIYVRLSPQAKQRMAGLLSRMARDRLSFGLAGR